jgi:DNA modification methylase
MDPYYSHAGITIYHGDCLEIMPELKPVDLVLTDPPYGIGVYKNGTMGGGVLAKQSTYDPTEWDDIPVNFKKLWSLISLGEYACCFGGNYYHFPPSRCWLIWDKENGDNNFADCELAWTNYPRAVRLKKHHWQGMLRKHHELRYHPTQKPLDVIKWAMQLSPKYDTILDPFMGSGTTLVAAKELGRKAIGIEIEEKYCEIAVRRLAQEVLPFKA